VYLSQGGCSGERSGSKKIAAAGCHALILQGLGAACRGFAEFVKRQIGSLPDWILPATSIAVKLAQNPGGPAERIPHVRSGNGTFLPLIKSTHSLTVGVR